AARAGLRHGADRLRRADRLSDLRVGRGPAERNSAHFAPHALLKFGAPDIERQRKPADGRRNVLDDFRDCGRAALLVTHQLRLGESRADIPDELRRLLAHHDRDDALVAGRNEHRSYRGSARAITNFFRRPAAEGSVSEHAEYYGELGVRVVSAP